MNWQEIDWEFLIRVIFNLLLSVVIGGLIGNERGRHGRAAGMRTHIIVCLGAALTSMMSVYMNKAAGDSGDVFRISAQVVCGVGFLGAGMIILKNNSVITGLTTAAGIWTTSIIGIAIGYGFYIGAIAAAVFCLGATVLLSKLEKGRKFLIVYYIEIDDMYKTNEVIDVLTQNLNVEFTYRVTAPKSGYGGHIGMDIIINKRTDINVKIFRDMENIVYAVEE